MPCRRCGITVYHGLWSQGFTARDIQSLNDGAPNARISSVVGLTSESGWDRIEMLVIKTKYFGYIALTAPSVDKIHDRADENLFKAVKLDSRHILQDLLPATTSHKQSLIRSQ